ETHSKVVTLGDVSGSMASRDDLPSESMPPEKLPTRQDKVIRFLTDDQIAFLRQIEQQNPIAFYRFGSTLDENHQVLEGGKLLSAEEWAAWLKPDPKSVIPEGQSEEEKAKLRKQQE